MSKKLFLVPVLVAALFTQSCTPSQVSVTLGAVNIAIDAVVAVLAVKGAIPPSDLMLITQYADAATVAGQETATEIASGDTTVVKSQKITAYWAAVVNSYNGLPPADQIVVGIIEKAIQQLLLTITPAATNADGSATFRIATKSNPNGTVNFTFHKVPAHFKISMMDRMALMRMGSKFKSQQEKLRTIENLKPHQSVWAN